MTTLDLMAAEFEPSSPTLSPEAPLVALKGTQREKDDLETKKEEDIVKYKPPRSDKRDSRHYSSTPQKKARDSTMTPRRTPSSSGKRTSELLLKRNSSNDSFLSTSSTVSDELLETSYGQWVERKERERKTLRQQIKEEKIRKEKDEATKKVIIIMNNTVN